MLGGEWLVSLSMNPQAAVSVMEGAARLSQLYTLGVVLAIIITIAFLYLVWAVMSTNEKREMRLVNLIDGSIRQMHNVLIEQNNRALEISAKLKDAEDRNREEHQAMIALLQRLLEK